MTKKTKFGILESSGKEIITHEIDLSKVKSSDPIAYSYGLVQGERGNPLEKSQDKLAPEYIRGWKEGHQNFMKMKKPKLPKPAKANPKLKSQFRQWAKTHPNFVTPHIVRLKASKNKVVELSEGLTMEHKPMYGVTIMKKADSGFKSLGGKPFFNEQQAIAYFNKMAKRVR